MIFSSRQSTMILSIIAVILTLTVVQAASIHKAPNITTQDLNLGVSSEVCNEFADWIGPGIIQEDCQAAINELYLDDLEPRGGQEYEFLRRGVSRESYFPWVTTPRKHWYRTCVVAIVMLDTFMPGTLPGEASDLPTLKSDTTTFNKIWEVANSVFNVCVKRGRPNAGWGYAGEHNSIGVFIIRNQGILDQTLVRDMMLTTTFNASSFSAATDLFRSPNASTVSDSWR
ncbi:hypothetical protein ACLMJK_001655 [Lecanora helva]